ncbi:MAG: hypothetical protein ACI86M_001969 [Saprospiraceae bacterium]|jgi:hypothetical protein
MMTKKNRISENDLQTSDALATTNITSPSVGQSLTAVVAGQDGLSVSSTSAFPSTTGYLLLSAAAESIALLQYVSTDGNAFKTLAQYSGNGATVLKSDMLVSEAETGNTIAGAGGTFASTLFSINAGPTFQGTGYICILGAGGNGIFKYDIESSTMPNDSTQGDFKSALLVNAFSVGAGQDPFAIAVGAGSVVIECSAPPPESTLTTSDITIPAKGSFTIDVVSTTSGFPRDSGYLLVPLSGGASAIVIYTGTTATSFTGCTGSVAGDIASNTTIQATANTAIKFGFTDNTGSSDEIFIAIAGQQSDALGNLTWGYLTQASAGADFKFKKITSETVVPTYTLFAASSPVGTTTSFNISNSPFSRLIACRAIFSIGSAPVINILSCKPSFPAASNKTNPNNPITYDFVEFTERNAPNDGVLFINTTQVDQVGIPFTMQVTPKDSIKTDGVGITKGYADLKTALRTYVTTQFQSIVSPLARSAAAAFKTLVTTDRILNPADAITNPPGGVVLPVLDEYFDVALTTFFNKYILATDAFILQRNGFCFSGQTVEGYKPAPYKYNATNTGATLIVGASVTTCLQAGMTVTGPGVIAGTTISSVSPPAVGVSTTITLSVAATGGCTADYTFAVTAKYTVLQLTEIISPTDTRVISGGQVYQIYAPYFGGTYPTSFPHSCSLDTSPAPPPWIKQHSAGGMVFGNLGAFADGLFQGQASQFTGTGASHQILLDIENTIVSAFNRGVANSVQAGKNVTVAWEDNTTFYAVANAGSNWSNFYAGFLHNDGVSRTAPNLSVGLAYGFAYDDQGGNDPTLASIFPTHVNITLNERNKDNKTSL